MGGLSVGKPVLVAAGLVVFFACVAINSTYNVASSVEAPLPTTTTILRWNEPQQDWVDHPVEHVQTTELEGMPQFTMLAEGPPYDCKKADTFHKDKDFDGDDLPLGSGHEGGFPNIQSASACCMKCEALTTCKYAAV